MGDNSGYLVLFGVLGVITVIVAMSIYSPFSVSEKDDEGAYLGYRVENVEQEDGYTYATVTIVNHGYADCKVTSFNVCYSTMNGSKTFVHSPINGMAKDCAKNGMCVITSIFDTDDAGEITMLSPYYRFVEY